MMLLEHEKQIKQHGRPVIVAKPVDVKSAPGRITATMPFTTSTVPVTKTIQWNAVSGADSVEVSTGSIKLGASNDIKALSGISLSKQGNHHVLTFPETVHLTSISLQGFTYVSTAGSPAVNFTASENSPLLVSIPNEQTQWLPVYIIPHLSKGSTPKQYAGASYRRQTISFPIGIQPVKKIRLSVVTNFGKDNEEILSSTITSASARIRNLPIDLSLTNDTDDSVLLEHKGLFLNDMPDVEFDLVNPAQAAFDVQLAQQQPLSFQYSVQAKTSTAFQYDSTAVKGALVRTFKGVNSTVLNGQALSLSLDLSKAKLDSQQAASVITDLTVSYEKLRVLDDLNDEVPLNRGDVNGQIVTDESVKRVLLNSEIASYPIDRIGLIGRAPEPCELSLLLIPQLDGIPGSALSSPGVVQLEASTEIQLVWIKLPQPVSHAGELVLSVRANSGRFLWVTSPQPAVKVVVQDPDPAGREIRFNNLVLTTLDQERLHLPKISIQPGLFVDEPPVLSSNLFVNIELTDLTLRYSR